jgi:hypothetical protein
MRQQRNRPSPLCYWHALATLWLIAGSWDGNVMQVQLCCSWCLSSAVLLRTFPEEWIPQLHRTVILKSRGLAVANDNSGRETVKRTMCVSLYCRKILIYGLYAATRDLAKCFNLFKEIYLVSEDWFRELCHCFQLFIKHSTNYRNNNNNNNNNNNYYYY